MTLPTAVFIGDSITDAGRTSDPAAPLGAGYVQHIHETVNNPRQQVTIINRGIAGDRVVDLARRWTTDVLALRPDILTVLVGVNDMWRRYDSADPTPATDFEAVYDGLVARARTSGVGTVVLMEPFLVPFAPLHDAWHEEDLDDKIAAVHAVAARHGLEMIALDARFNHLARIEGAAAVVADGVHPTPRGHQLIADAWLEWAGRRGLIRDQ